MYTRCSQGKLAGAGRRVGEEFGACKIGDFEEVKGRCWRMSGIGVEIEFWCCDGLELELRFWDIDLEEEAFRFLGTCGVGSAGEG
jgi:hypothetical protein